MKTQLRDLIVQGLTADNLRASLRLARQLFYGRPTLYGSLIPIFESVLAEYDDFDAIDANRFAEINRDLVPWLLGAIDAEFDPPGALLVKLDELHKAWFVL